MSFKPPTGPATASTRGVVKLAGDLSGTADAPTVPGLASKLSTSQLGVADGVASLDSSGKIPSGQLALTFPVTSVASKTGDVALVKADVGLDNVDNTSDANKPISSATQTALNGKASTTHSHAISDVTNLQVGLDAKADQATTYTKAEVDSALGGKASTSHTHTASEVSDTTVTGRALMTAADAATARTAIGAGTSNLALGTTGTTAKAGDYVPAWTEVTSKPSTFTPSAHVHPISDVTNLQTTLDGKAATTHSHVIADTTGLQTALDAKAATSHTHTASQISDSTAVGRGVLTATDAAAAQAIIGVTNTVQVVNAFADVTTPTYGTLYVVRA